MNFCDTGCHCRWLTFSGQSLNLRLAEVVDVDVNTQ